MLNLVIDIGNTLVKTAIFDGNELIWLQSQTDIADGQLNDILNTYKPKKAIIASVRKHPQPWEESLAGQIQVTHFSATMAKSVKNHYRTPHTLGLDRLAGVAGAHALYLGTASLVIDAGTCITYDYIDAEGNYFGGSISPGLNMRYQALNHYTDGLPLLQPDHGFKGGYGYDTATAIHSGIQNGLAFEVAGFMDSYAKTGGKINIVLTGGDSFFFDTLLKNSIFAPQIKNEPYLVLKGLNAVIQQHND